MTYMCVPIIEVHCIRDENANTKPSVFVVVITVVNNFPFFSPFRWQNFPFSLRYAEGRQCPGWSTAKVGRPARLWRTCASSSITEVTHCIRDKTQKQKRAIFFLFLCFFDETFRFLSAICKGHLTIKPFRTPTNYDKMLCQARVWLSRLLRGCSSDLSCVRKNARLLRIASDWRLCSSN